MKLKTFGCSAIVAIHLLLALPMTLQAAIPLEEIGWGLCSEGGQEVLPKKITLLQVINEKAWSGSSGTDIFLDAAYLSRFQVSGGGVIVKGTVIKEDGTRSSLPRLVGKIRFGFADQSKASAVALQRGDMIEWKVKLKGLDPLSGAGDCFALELLLSEQAGP